MARRTKHTGYLSTNQMAHSNQKQPDKSLSASIRFRNQKNRRRKKKFTRHPLDFGQVVKSITVAIQLAAASLFPHRAPKMKEASGNATYSMWSNRIRRCFEFEADADVSIGDENREAESAQAHGIHSMALLSHTPIRTMRTEWIVIFSIWFGRVVAPMQNKILPLMCHRNPGECKTKRIIITKRKIHNEPKRMKTKCAQHRSFSNKNNKTKQHQKQLASFLPCFWFWISHSLVPPLRYHIGRRWKETLRKLKKKIQRNSDVYAYSNSTAWYTCILLNELRKKICFARMCVCVLLWIFIWDICFIR